MFGTPPRIDQVFALIIDCFFFGLPLLCVLLSEILNEILKSFPSNYCPQIYL